MNEAETRKELIDQQLEEAGWQLNDPTMVVEEFQLGDINWQADDTEPRPYGNGFSDYVLLGKDGKPLAVVEAKRSSRDAENGREQAKQYCLRIQENTGELPYCFYTNGLDIFFWDIGNYPPKKVLGYPTRDDLERYQHQRRHRKPLAAEMINTRIAGRDYQIQAIRTIMEAVAKKHNRFLLVMATGTGKTRTCIALVDALMRAGWIERTLFLVDRIALRKQALDAFKEHLPNEPRWPKEGETQIKPGRRIYVSTYPTMLNSIRSESDALSPHFFDLVVVDESHRSIYNTYQEVLNYFNTLTLGLTATPTELIDHNTFQLFNCEDGLPNFAYSLDEAINHQPPYLCNFEVLQIRTRFQLDGINQRTISLEDQKRLMLEGKDVTEIDFEGSELEKTVTNRGTNAIIVRSFMDECIKDANGLPGKTIFFCMSKKHARRIEELFDALYPEYAGELAKRMVSEDSGVHGKGGLLEQFKKRNMPRIAISVDMLDTGIDVHEIVNLVFAKPVYSYTKFWQMIGRGTRRLNPETQKAWCTEKERFLILDCWDNFEYFKINPKGKTPGVQVPLPIRHAGLRIDKIEMALELGEDAILQKEIDTLKEQIAQLPAQSVVIKEAQAHLQKTKDDDFWSALNHERIHWLHHKIKPLFKTLAKVDFKDMRFRKDVLEVSLVHLRQDNDAYDALVAMVQERIEEVPKNMSQVSPHLPYIRQVLSPAFWVKATDRHFDEVADVLAPLMKYIDDHGPRSAQQKHNLKDLLVQKEKVEFGPENEAVSTARYREMVEARIAALISKHPVLQQIRDGLTVSQEDIEALARQLENEHPNITESLLQKVYNNHKAHFIEFIQHILGIKPLLGFDELVNRAVQAFIEEHSYMSTRQFDFLNLMKNFIIERGGINKQHLIESPFTHMHPKGIRGLFTPKEINEIVKLAEELAA